MADAVLPPELEALVTPFRAKVKEQGDKIRELKANGAPALDIAEAVTELKHRRKLLEDKVMELTPSSSEQESKFDRIKMEELLKRRFFYMQSFSIYGGVGGLYDMGPVGCALKANVLKEWRDFFILEEGMLEVDCSILTPEPVLKASGHVDRFSDYMVKDTKTGECFRLDHLIKGHLEKLGADKKATAEAKAKYVSISTRLDGMSMEEMKDILREYDMKSPTTGNPVSDPMEFNLMFQTEIGPTGNYKGFLRPETAQGIFVNFKKLLEFNQGKLPFAAAQIGNAFRNEISPRSGLIRVREFTMGEIEHFCDPTNKDHPKFYQVRDRKATFFSACNQMDGQPPAQLTFGEAVDSKLVANQTLGYYLARLHMFLERIGIDPARLRLRQHMGNEMAHYACDCWDAEIKTSYGWVECVGCADRSAYDLTQHTKASKTKLCAEKSLPEPVMVDVLKVTPNKQLLGKTFKAKAKVVLEKIESLDKEEGKRLKEELETSGTSKVTVNDEDFEITKEMIKISEIQEKISVEEFVPSVIEPSFGIGRIIYSLLEHSYKVRDEDEQRGYFTLPAIVAPFKCSVLPLSGADELQPLVQSLSNELRKAGVSHKIDDASGSIGKRYARTDEVAIPFGVTIDFDSVRISPATVTLRERDSMDQIRLPLEDLARVVSDLSDGRTTWKEVEAKYPKFTQQQTVDKKDGAGEE
ncbi:unnamed protein product [Notodromas monacha]|uniref:Glycine--tRNA ligase n=2 Tax=Notodromas monacha TaxID=399045 RepID=A0A7R9BIN1_9CRUS|nr:unnamed protein product [Notodromas monacha]CAG0915327.1 unnamed protein product [Notodromas monacha]